MSAAYENVDWRRHFAQRRKEFRAKISSKAVPDTTPPMPLRPVALPWLKRQMIVNATLYPYPIGPCRPWLEDGKPDDAASICLAPKETSAFAQARRLRQIVADVCARHGVTAEELTSERRTKAIAEARQEAFYLVQQAANWSLPRIGRFFGGRDHTTVLHGIRAHRERLAKAAAQARETW